jgi:hypothetical protein
MRFLYLDPGLKQNLGHHPSSCRFITRELQRRGIETKILAFAGAERRVLDEFQALPHFRCFTYWVSDGDPICGWLNAFHRAALTTKDDMSRLGSLNCKDIVYLNSGQAAQLMGIALWLADLPAGQMPNICFEFGVEPGLDCQIDSGRASFAIRDPRKDPRAVLLRHAACCIPKTADGRLHLGTFDANSSAAYAALLKKPVLVFPCPRIAVSEIRCRARARPITVSILGHQRPDKGYQFVPEVVKRLLTARSEIKVYIHNGDPQLMHKTQAALRALSSREPRLSLDERVADEHIWKQLLDLADLIICPYDVVRFATSYSAVAVEAVANAIPLVVPNGTSLARLLADFGGAGTAFERTDPMSIVNATLRAIDDFDRLASLAMTGAKKWSHACGAACFVDAVTRICNSDR